MNSPVVVGLCGLTGRDARLIEIVVSRAPNPKHILKIGDHATMGRCELAIVDIQSPNGQAALGAARKLNPELVPIFVSDSGAVGESQYRITRASLLLMVLRTIERAIDDQGPARSNAAAPAKPATGSSDTALVADPDKSAGTRTNEFLPLRALVVDDSLTVRRQLEAALQQAGIQPATAENAEGALVEIGKQAFDLIFLDVVMPGIDGYELCRQIKQSAYTRRTPILMLTSRSSPFDRARGALAGCDAYLVKPISAQTFFGAVDKQLARHFQNNRALLAARGYRAAAG